MTAREARALLIAQKLLPGSGSAAATIKPLSVTENGTFNPPQGVDGFSPVTVAVPDGDLDYGGNFSSASGTRLIRGRYASGFTSGAGYYFPKTPMDDVPAYDMTKPFHIRLRVKLSALMTREQALIGDNTTEWARPVIAVGTTSGTVLMTGYFSTTGTEWDVQLSVAKNELPFVADQWYTVDYSWANGTFAFAVSNGTDTVTKTAAASHFTTDADGGSSRVQIGARKGQLYAQNATVDLYETYWEQDGVLVWGNKPGGDKPDITKAPVPSGSPALWAYLLIDNSLDGFPKSVNDVFTGRDTTWERGYLNENNEFVVETTQTETSNTGITIDYSDVARRWVIYRMQSNYIASTYNWSRTLYQLPVVAVRGWCEASATSAIQAIAPPQGGLGQFPQLRELYWGGLVSWHGQYSVPTRWLEVIDFSKVTDFRSNIINFNYSIDYMESLRELKLPKILTRVPVSSPANNGFIWASSLISLDLSMFDFSSVTSMSSFFQYMLSLETLNLSGADFTAQGTATIGSISFDQGYHLKNLILDNATLWSKHTSFAWSPLLTHDSLIALIAALPTLDGITRTLTLHPDALARLSAAEIAVANGKGWTVS